MRTIACGVECKSFRIGLEPKLLLVFYLRMWCELETRDFQKMLATNWCLVQKPHRSCQHWTLALSPVALPWLKTRPHQFSGPWEFFWRPGCPCALQEQTRCGSSWAPKQA